jgi:hypothetical protein
MSNQDWPFQFERVNYCQHVFAEAVRHVLCGCITGRAETAPGNTIYMVVDSKLWREIIKYMGRISASGQKNN